MTSVLDRRNQVVGSLHAALYRATSGRVRGRIGQAEVVLVTTTGRRSGQPRAVPLMALHRPRPDRARRIERGPGQAPGLVPERARQPGGHRPPRRRHPRDAGSGHATEKAELWPRIVESWDRYDTYQRKTTRDIPLLIVE